MGRPGGGSNSSKAGKPHKKSSDSKDNVHDMSMPLSEFLLEHFDLDEDPHSRQSGYTRYATRQSSSSSKRSPRIRHATRQSSSNSGDNISGNSSSSSTTLNSSSSSSSSSRSSDSSTSSSSTSSSSN